MSYPVTLTLDQTGKALKAGMSATAEIVTDQATGIAVPGQALSGSSVTVVGKDGKQTTQRVQTGVVGDSTTQILSGLGVGDKIVVRSAAATAGAAAGAANQLNNALGNRAAGNGFGGGLGGGRNGFGGRRWRRCVLRRAAGRRAHAVTPAPRRIRRPVIQVQDIERVYRITDDLAVTALDGVSLQIERGESWRSWQLGQRQEHADEHPRLPRRADRRALHPPAPARSTPATP